jgi:hypothetical protein
VLVFVWLLIDLFGRQEVSRISLEAERGNGRIEFILANPTPAHPFLELPNALRFGAGGEGRTERAVKRNSL